MKKTKFNSESELENEKMRAEDVFLSIVIPIYNEEENIEPLYHEILTAVEDKYRDFEIIFINDGSRDRSFKKLKTLNKKDERVKVINFRKNFGQSNAISAGFDQRLPDELSLDASGCPFDGQVAVQNDVR